MAKHLIETKSDLRKAVKELCTHTRLSVDTETFGEDRIGGLHPFHNSRAFAVIFATKDSEYYFNFNVGGINPKYIAELQPIFEDTSRIMFFVNAIFDCCILHFHGIEMECRIVDCPSIARVEYNLHDGGNYNKDESFLSLEYLADYYDVPVKKDDRVKKYIVEHNLYHENKCRFTGKKIPRYDLVPLDLMFEYGCSDGRATFDIGTEIIKCINHKDSIYGFDAKMIDVAKNEIKLTTVLVDMKIKGVKLWTDYVEKAVVYERDKAEVLNGEIDKLTGGININSGKQVAEYLISKGVKVSRKEPTDNARKMIRNWEVKRSGFIAELQIEEKESKKVSLTKKIEIANEKMATYKLGNYITDKKTLAKYLKKHPELDFLSKITEAKEAEKKLGTYYLNFLKLKDENDIVHCNLSQAACVTGRFSSSSPNLQNVEKVKWNGREDHYIVRRSFIPPKGFMTVTTDYKSCEFMVMVDQAADMPVIKDVVENGTDLYLAMAAKVKELTGIEITRQQAKALSLGVGYGQGVRLIANNLKCSLDQAKAFKEAFLTGLKGVDKLNRKLMRTAQREGKIVNPSGRICYFPDRDFAYKAMNSFVQSESADIMKRALVDIHEFLKDKKSHLALTIHDEAYYHCHDDEHYIIPMIAEIMSKAYNHLHMPLKTDIECSNRGWAEKLTWEEK